MRIFVLICDVRKFRIRWQHTQRRKTKNYKLTNKGQELLVTRVHDLSMTYPCN